MGTKLPRRLWQDMTTKDFAALASERVIAVLPVGAIEQHGPHLPVFVDACLCQGVVDETIRRLPDDLPVTFLPLLPVGKSNEHIDFPGTLTLSAETLTRLWTEVGESVARAGIRKFVILNSHGGQVQIMEVVARELRVRCQMFVVTLSYSNLGVPPGLFPDTELRHGIHAGSRETAMMMHLRPDLVRDKERRNFIPRTIAMEQDYAILGKRGTGLGFGWQVQDLNEDGACGDARDADAERGRRVVEHAAARFVELLKEIDRYPLSALR
ncbi:MAG: creatininase family protein [Pseudomonadota bacterium]|nr:creatininase family protein [Pseudomonadota bacterium]